MSVRASIVHKSEVTLELPYSVDVKGGGMGEPIEVVMPLATARSLYYALKDAFTDDILAGGSSGV